MVACLSSLKRLESLWLQIRSSDQPSPHPHARAVLPSLTKFTFFKGKSKSLEDFVARIDTPCSADSTCPLNLSVVIFDIPHLRQFIVRARGLEPCRAARVTFDSYDSCSIVLEFPPHVSRLHIARIDLQEISMALVCGQLSPLFSVSFTTIRGLYVSKSLLLPVATALQGLIGERATEVLPNLRSLFLWSIPTFQPIAIHSWKGKGAET
ncbi:hypothetical protein BC826DRAFT_1054733 [Russula brevipes]|nr:hypothetical protein BC826DRAFT_1054733 [Russula brevipes]